MDVNGKTIDQLQQLMIKGKISAKLLCLEYMKNITELDSSNSGLNSVAEINPEALATAELLDEERMLGKSRGPLHGIPVLLKDNINTGDKMHTTAGSLALNNNYAPYDAGLVRKLRKAGMIILGKTNMTEFANFMTHGMPGGYSSRGGQVLNPHDRKESPSGSSAGSAVAVYSNLCSVAIGTETEGSIMSPAQINGVVGIKPTKGLVSASGVIPISSTLDTAGPMARTVKDAAMLLEAMSGKDDSDTSTSLCPDKIIYSEEIEKSSLNGIRIGINRAYMSYFDNDRLSRCNNLIKTLSDAGADLVEIDDIKAAGAVGSITRHEFKNSLNYYLSKLAVGFPIKTLDDIIEFNKTNRCKALKYGQKTLIDAKYFTSGQMTEVKYLKALLQREKRIIMADKVMMANNLDVVLHMNHYINIAALIGFPCMTIPIGKDEKGMPVGMNMMARRFEEKILIQTMYALEKILKYKKN